MLASTPIASKPNSKRIHILRDVAYHQSVDYPTVPVEIDRERAGLSGMTAKQVADAILVSTSSSRYVARNYWRDPKSGVDYQVEVLVPTKRMNSTRQVETIPLRRVSAARTCWCVTSPRSAKEVCQGNTIATRCSDF